MVPEQAVSGQASIVSVVTPGGFRPFLVGYSITCFMQAFTLIYTVEVLQRCVLLFAASL